MPESYFRSLLNFLRKPKKCLNLFSSRLIFINILAPFDSFISRIARYSPSSRIKLKIDEFPLNRNDESNSLKILINFCLEKSLNDFIDSFI